MNQYKYHNKCTIAGDTNNVSNKPHTEKHARTTQTALLVILKLVWKDDSMTLEIKKK